MVVCSARPLGISGGEDGSRWCILLCILEVLRWAQGEIEMSSRDTSPGAGGSRTDGQTRYTAVNQRGNIAVFLIPERHSGPGSQELTFAAVEHSKIVRFSGTRRARACSVAAPQRSTAAAAKAGGFMDITTTRYRSLIKCISINLARQPPHVRPLRSTGARLYM